MPFPWPYAAQGPATPHPYLAIRWNELFSVADPDLVSGNLFDPGSMKKFGSGIRDENPGSATLELFLYYLTKYLSFWVYALSRRNPKFSFQPVPVFLISNKRKHWAQNITFFKEVEDVAVLFSFSDICVLGILEFCLLYKNKTNFQSRLDQAEAHWILYMGSPGKRIKFFINVFFVWDEITHII
jgi:hypothetical protein